MHVNLIHYPKHKVKHVVTVVTEIKYTSYRYVLIQK